MDEPLKPMDAQKFKHLSGIASQLTGSVSGSYIAGILQQKLAYGVTAGEPYYTPGCTSNTQCVFPNAVIPLSAWSVPAQRMLQYIPAPNNAGGTFSTSAYNQTLRDDKAGARLDWNSPW